MLENKKKRNIIYLVGTFILIAFLFILRNVFLFPANYYSIIPISLMLSIYIVVTYNSLKKIHPLKKQIIIPIILFHLGIFIVIIGIFLISYTLGFLSEVNVVYIWTISGIAVCIYMASFIMILWFFKFRKKYNQRILKPTTGKN